MATIPGVTDPVQLIYDLSNHYIYVAGQAGDSVSIIDTTANKHIINAHVRKS
jgi:YVTN family beta-propeller protein